MTAAATRICVVAAIAFGVIAGIGAGKLIPKPETWSAGR